MTFLLATWFATIVPNRDQYWCKLQWMERQLCIYRCWNEKKAFDWFEKKPEKGCKIKKMFYTT